MSETANWAEPKIIRAFEETDDNLLKRLLAQSTFYLWDESGKTYWKVWWRPGRYGAYSSWETDTLGILNRLVSIRLENSRVQMAEVIALFGDQIPDWMRVNLDPSDEDLVQRTVRPTPGNLLDKIIAAQAREQGVAVETVEAAMARMAREMQANPDLVLSFIESISNLSDSIDEREDTYNTGSTSVVTIRTF